MTAEILSLNSMITLTMITENQACSFTLHTDGETANRLRKRCEVGLPGAGSWMIPASGVFFLLTVFLGSVLADFANAQPPVGVGPGVSVSANNDLLFGTLLTGAPYTILPSDPEAAAFQIRRPGPPGATMDISFSLPSQLLGPGAAIPITFGPNSLEWDVNQNGNNRQPANPALPLRLRAGGGGRLFLWLGATVDVPMNIPNGDYGNVIVITVTEVFN
jgi:hypothetical protein